MGLSRRGALLAPYRQSDGRNQRGRHDGAREPGVPRRKARWVLPGGRRLGVARAPVFRGGSDMRMRMSALAVVAVMGVSGLVGVGDGVGRRWDGGCGTSWGLQLHRWCPSVGHLHLLVDTVRCLLLSGAKRNRDCPSPPHIGERRWARGGQSLLWFLHRKPDWSRVGELECGIRSCCVCRHAARLGVSHRWRQRPLL